MEAIIYILLFFGGMWLLQATFEAISNWNDKRKSKIRDQVAEEIFPKADTINKLISTYKNKLKEIGYSENQEYSWFYKQILSDGRKTYMGLVGKCPACSNGDLIVRKGRYGKFIGCTSYPSCNYTVDIKEAKEEYKKSIQDEFFNDIHKAYS